MTRVKICGVMSAETAAECARIGAHAIGINFVSSSPRRVDEHTAREIVRAVAGRAIVVAVVADLTVHEMREMKETIGVDCLQLHGDETPEVVASMLPHAYKAVRVRGSSDIARADEMPGAYVLVDAKVDGALGGTGTVCDWALVVALARRRRLTLAGGLTPDNVGAAIDAVHPWCVDTASGVEDGQHRKDLDKVRAFIDAVREADWRTQAATAASGPSARP
ncbi:MAG: phosphoribosylanthranilate isomerase [Polyangiaceae bacterium]|jgi:phosphoribosylanthranilate isomerase